jgi:hypothetical protein
MIMTHRYSMQVAVPSVKCGTNHMYLWDVVKSLQGLPQASYMDIEE